MQYESEEIDLEEVKQPTRVIKVDPNLGTVIVKVILFFVLITFSFPSFFVGLLFSGGAGFFAYQQYHKEASFTPVNGHVSDIEKIRSNDSDYYSYIVNYEVNGRQYKVSPLVNKGGNLMNKQKGDLVQVKYNPKNPSDAIIVDKAEIVIFIVAFVLGFICLIMGLGSFIGIMKMFKNMKNIPLNANIVQQ